MSTFDYSSATFALVMFINFYPSKLFPFTNFPRITGPDAERASFLFKAGNEVIYLLEGFLDMLVFNGLSPLGLPFRS